MSNHGGKLVLNGSYGAFATPYFILFNNHVAGTITAQGRTLTQTMHKVNEDYWYNQWHLDTELHQKMNLKNVTPIPRPVNNVTGGEEVSIYADTDSIFSESLIRTNKGEYSIENWYNENIKNGSGGNTVKGHESVLTNDKILNYSKDNGIYYAPVKRIIRHKVTKAKWKLKTKSGKEILVTNDHSMIVFRNGNQIEVKPSEILKTDKILVLKS
jgi:Intein splicing domain/DNA polymerase family B